MNYLFVIGGTGAQKFRGDGNERNPSPTDADVPDGTNLRFHLSGMIANHSRNLGRVGKIETLAILQICPHSSQTIGDIYNFEFSLVGKIWDGQETVKIFPTYENQASVDMTFCYLGRDNVMTSFILQSWSTISDFNYC